MLTVAATALLATGCGTDSSGGREDNAFAETAAGFFRRGVELGALDAQGGLPSDYRRHVERFDSPFVVQFESGYQQGYGRYSR